jgi:dihydroorotate dehydrogenase (NAD+) catalytic subunit
MKRSLAVDLNGLRFANPVIAASGCLGTGRDVPGLVDLHRLGGVVSRSLTLAPSRGAPTPRSAETPSGLLSAVGLQNPGVEAFVEHDLPRFTRTGVPVIGSVAGGTLEEFIRVAQVLHRRAGVVALELHLSSPDQERGGGPVYARLDRVLEVVGAVARTSTLPVFAKLPPLVPDLVETARACVRAGAFGLTLVDAMPGLGVDAARLRPRTGVPVAGLSGPALKPVALAAVFQVARAMPEVPLLGVGGIFTGMDAVEFLLAGAWAVQVGTALLVNPGAPVEIAHDLLGYLRGKGIASPGDLRGRLRVRGDIG